ncbi:GAF domain-containing protein [bacterium]|nr:GAF domain-containing protein [bacterium]
MPVRETESLLGFFSGSQMNRVMYEAAHVARVVLKVEASVIFLLSPDHALHPASWDGRELSNHDVSLDSIYIKSLWEGRRSIAWNQRDRCKDAEIGAVLDVMGLESGMILPLIMDDWYYGVWMVATTANRSFSDIDESILSALRDNIALTTESMIISEENFRLQREASALYEINKEISQLMDLNKVLKTIVEKTCSLMGAELSYLSLADNEKQEVRVVLTEGTRADELRKMVLKYGEGVGGAVAVHRSPELVHSYTKDPRPKSAATAYQAASEGIESIISVPMFTRRGLIGVLFAASRHEHAFNQSQMDLLAGLGTQAAIAIENASLYEQEKITAEKLRTSMSTSEQLVRLVLRNQGLQSITDTLSELVSASVVVENNRHHILSASHPAPHSPAEKRLSNGMVSSADIWNDPDLSQQVHVLRDAHHSVTIPLRPHKSIPFSRFVVPITAGENLFGYIIAADPSGELNEQQRSAVEQASIVMALEFLKQEAAQAVEQRLAGDFLDDVINGRCANDQSAVQRAARMNVDLHSPHLVMILDVDQFSDEIAKHRWTDLDALAIKRRILSIATDIAHKTHPGSLVGMQSDSALLLVPTSDESEYRVGLELGKKIQQALQIALPDLTISIGVGRAVKNYTDIPSSYQDAQISLHASATSSKRGRVLAYAELGVLPLLLQSRSQTELVAFMHSSLDPLLAHDAQKDSDLVPTLRAYLASSGHLQRTASDCHIHINTLKYRMQRIEEILNLDLSNGETRFNLQLALTIQGMQELLENRPE